MSLLQLSLDLKIVRCILNTWSIFLYLIAAYFIAVVSILSSCINGNIEMITNTWISCRYCVSVPQILPEIINIWFEETGASFWMFTLMCWVDCLIYSFFPIFYNLWVVFFFWHVYTSVSCMPGICRNQTRRRSQIPWNYRQLWATT